MCVKSSVFSAFATTGLIAAVVCFLFMIAVKICVEPAVSAENCSSVFDFNLVRFGMSKRLSLLFLLKTVVHNLILIL